MKLFAQFAVLSALLTVMPGVLHADFIFGPHSYWDLEGQAITHNDPNPPGVEEFQTINIHRDTYSSAGGSAVTSRANVSFFGSVAPGTFRVSASGFASGFQPSPGNIDDVSSSAGNAYARVEASSTETLTLSVPGSSDGQLATMRFSYYSPEFVVSGHSMGALSGYNAVMGFAVTGIGSLDDGGPTRSRCHLSQVLTSTTCPRAVSSLTKYGSHSGCLSR